MNTFWQENTPALFVRTRQDVEDKYPGLRFDVRNRIVFLAGDYPVADKERVLDTFQIEVEMPARFSEPWQLPIVRETANLIPRTADFHMFTNGSCCLLVEEDWWAAHPEGCTLIEFLDGPVRNFFLGQAMVKRGLPWPFGQRSHGADGILECYADLTGATNLPIAEEFLKHLTKKKITGHHPCPCGSGKILRHCHQKLLRALREKIPLAASRKSWIRVQELRSKYPKPYASARRS